MAKPPKDIATSVRQRPLFGATFDPLTRYEALIDFTACFSTLPQYY
jgi:hypothetical protein